MYWKWKWFSQLNKQPQRLKKNLEKSRFDPASNTDLCRDDRAQRSIRETESSQFQCLYLQFKIWVISCHFHQRQPRSQSSPAISDVTSPVNSPSLPWTQIARTGLGTRLHQRVLHELTMARSPVGWIERCSRYSQILGFDLWPFYGFLCKRFSLYIGRNRSHKTAINLPMDHTGET